MGAAICSGKNTVHNFLRDNAKKIHETAKNVRAGGESKAIVQSVNVIFVWGAKCYAKLRKTGQKLKASVIVFFAQQVMSGGKKSSPDEPKLFSCTRPENEEDSVLSSNERSQVTVKELECINHQRQETVKWLPDTPAST